MGILFGKHEEEKEKEDDEEETRFMKFMEAYRNQRPISEWHFATPLDGNEDAGPRMVNHGAEVKVSPETKAFFNARSSIELPPPPPPPAPPPPDFLDDMNPDNPQHFNHPAVHEDGEFGHNVVQLAVPDPLPHPAPPPPDLLD